MAIAPARARRRPEPAASSRSSPEPAHRPGAGDVRPVPDRAQHRGDERGDAYGVVDPETIILLFTNDEARPPLSFTIGDLASDGLGRYLLMPDGREIVTIPDVQLIHLIDLAEALEP